MARINRATHFVLISLYFSIFSCCLFNFVNANKELDEDNWREILEGEWMVEFYAPWCPACGALAPAWRELGSLLGTKAKVGAVDVTKAPGLSGRFMVTALPTIFHVKDGEFRQYKGPRDAESLSSFVLLQRWKRTDPVASWKTPHSMQMSLVAEFFKLSQVLRNVHNTLMETYGLPTWGSYLIFAIATIIIGALLGLLLVCIIDLLYPPRRSSKVMVTQEEADQRARGDDDVKPEEDLINDDIVDDQDSDQEKNSASDSSSSEGEAAAAAGGDSAGEDKAPEVRKRRPRKAD